MVLLSSSSSSSPVHKKAGGSHVLRFDGPSHFCPQEIHPLVYQETHFSVFLPPHARPFWHFPISTFL